MIIFLSPYSFSEVETLLAELADCRELLTNAEHTVQLREQELFEERRANEVTQCASLSEFVGSWEKNNRPRKRSKGWEK